MGGFIAAKFALELGVLTCAIERLLIIEHMQRAVAKKGKINICRRAQFGHFLFAV